MPDRQCLYDAMVTALSDELTFVPSNQNEGKQRFFGSNGMSICLERPKFDAGMGLFEVATPECQGPEALCLSLRAIDEQLVRSLPAARAHLASQGFEGTFGLLKNSRDDQGEYYGRQENLETEFARDGWLLAWQLFMVLMVPWTLFILPVYGIGLILALPLIFGLSREGFDMERSLGPLTLIHATPVLLVASWVGFRQVRGPLEGFLISRQAVTGTGWVNAVGTLVLSEKGAGITRWYAQDIRLRTAEHAVFDLTNLTKDVLRLQLRAMFSERKRLQLGLADSNRCEVAEVVGVTATARVLELAERGRLDDAPRFHDPVAAVHTLGDVELRATVIDQSGRSWTALELQSYYQTRAAEVFPDDPVVTLWGEAIQGLRSEPEAWIGRIDWVTKRWLLEQCGDDEAPAVQKRIDLGYHELGPEGLYDRIMAVVEPPPLLDPEEVAWAACHAPAGPAAHRAALIVEHGNALSSVAWSQVSLGGKVIFLGDRRR